jgi:hypothetical protein
VYVAVTPVQSAALMYSAFVLPPSASVSLVHDRMNEKVIRTKLKKRILENIN